MQSPGLVDVDVWVVRLGSRNRRLARDAMRSILGRYLNTTVDSLEIEVTPAGRPYLRGDPLHFNLSHSWDLALVAVCGEAPVGVDLEHPREFRAPDRLARRICSEREYAWLSRAGGAPNAPGALLRLWVRKEAAVKGTGDGLSRELNEVDVLDDTLAGGWLCVDLPSPAPGYRAALAVRARTPSISLREWRLDQTVRR
jgi:4'-phosphopantetheinyl transferase